MRLSTRGAGNDCRNDRSSSTRGVSCDAPQGAEQEHRRCELRRPARSGARAPEVRVATPRKERSKSTRGVSCDAPQGAEQEHRRCELRLSERQEFEHRRCELRRPARSGARAPEVRVATVGTTGVRAPEVRVATVGTTGVREGRRPLLCDGSSEPELEHRRCDLRAPNGPRPSTSRHGYGRVDRPETDRDAASVAGSGSSPAQAVLQGTNRTGEVPGGLPLRLYEMVGVRRFRFSYSHSVASPYEG